jgi:hypothetical protein
MQNPAVTQMFQAHLLPGEKLLWTGQPDPNILFSQTDYFLIPLTLIWTVFFFFATWNIWDPVLHGNPDSFIFPDIILIIFLLIGVYILFGRFFFKKWKKQRTFYAVTNRRVLVLTKTFGEQLQESNIKLIPAINKRVRSDGIGTLIFGENESIFSNRGRLPGNSGMDILPNSVVPLAFYDIPNANEVHRLLTDIQFKE